MNIIDVEKYINYVIPNIEKELMDESKSLDELLELYDLYENVLVMVAPYNFHVYNKALEFHEDKTLTTKGFYHHRKTHIWEIFEGLNQMEVYDKYDLILISLSPRVGKEQPLYSKILTPNGWTTMGNIQIGNKIIGSDGKSHNVTGVFPQGIKDVYTVIFDDGTKVECGLEHLWTVQTRDDRRRNKQRTVTTKEMMKNLYVENGKRKNYSIDYVKPVEFESTLKDDDLKPYLLGALIGDGSFNKTGVRFTNMDNDILQKVRDLLPANDKLNQIPNTIEYNIVKKDKSRRSEFGYAIPQDTLIKLREYELSDKNSDEKFIPKRYLIGSLEERVELLRGLMDTDGYCCNQSNFNNSYNEYTTTSYQLSLDIMELIQSLGGRVTCSTKIGSYKKYGVTHKCKLVYRITFNLEHINPFYCNRKSELFIPRKTRNCKYITSIEKTGQVECQCIMVDSPDHLYVTDGYNLTHNTTSGIRFLSWIMGRHPDNTQLATSYSDSITNSFYAGVMEIIQGEQYIKIFPDAPLIGQNAKRQEIWLKVAKRYPTISFVSIGGSMVGRSEAGNYLYCDDLVSGIEEALSIGRMDKLWELYTVNARQRKKDGAKEVHIATRWSVHDPITKLAEANKDNPRCKIISIPALDEYGESNFNFFGGFSAKYYEDLRDGMDSFSFNALYMCEPIEREGLLYHEDEMQYYLDLPQDRPDTIISVCDSKNLGKDYVASAIGYVYGDLVYIEDVVYNNGLPEVTIPLVAQKWHEHNVVRGDVEMNNGGNYFATGIDDHIKLLGGNSSLRLFFTGNNKVTKIITYSDFVKKQFIFKDKSKYHPNSPYAQFMKDTFKWTQTGKNPHDDAPDVLAMLAQLIQDIRGNEIKILDRRKLRI